MDGVVRKLECMFLYLTPGSRHLSRRNDLLEAGLEQAGQTICEEVCAAVAVSANKLTEAGLDTH